MTKKRDRFTRSRKRRCKICNVFARAISKRARERPVRGHGWAPQSSYNAKIIFNLLFMLTHLCQEKFSVIWASRIVASFNLQFVDDGTIEWAFESTWHWLSTVEWARTEAHIRVPSLVVDASGWMEEWWSHKSFFHCRVIGNKWNDLWQLHSIRKKQAAKRTWYN